MFQDLADDILKEGQQDLILDRAFYAKEDRDLYRYWIRENGAREVLLYFQVPRDVLWSRICARRKAGVDADCALEISKELLDEFVDGFDVPNGEGEIVLQTNAGATCSKIVGIPKLARSE